MPYKGIYYVTDIINIPMQEAGTLSEPGDRNNLDAVFYVSVSANREKYAMVREEAGMYDALMDLMSDAIDKKVEESRTNMISAMLKNSLSADQIADFTGIPIDEIRKVEEQMLALA